MIINSFVWKFNGYQFNYIEFISKQVITVKRLCVKKLPPILAIQLKRFEFDYERNNAIKYNDYFEFPRELDMEPYTGNTSIFFFSLRKYLKRALFKNHNFQLRKNRKFILWIQ